MKLRFWLAALAAITLLRLYVASRLPLAPDEAYYWLWAQPLQAGYYDHPPMIALWIRAGTEIAGQNWLGVRLFGPLAGVVGSFLLAQAAEDFFPGRQAGLTAAILLNATVLVGVGVILMTPDTPLFFFWVCGLTALGRLIATGNKAWWLAVGTAAGAALLSKYTGLLFIIGVGLWLVTEPTRRADLRSPWPWAALLLAFLMFTPDIWWNAQHHWVSYFKQGKRFDGFNAGYTFRYLMELVTGQIGLVTPIIFALAATGLWRLRQQPGPAGHLLVWLTIVPGLVFLEHIITDRVQANWPAILYPSAIIAAVSLPQNIMRRWFAPALILGFGLTFVAYVQALAKPFPVPVWLDPGAMQLGGWKDFADTVAARQPKFITSDDYGMISEFSMMLPPSVIVAGFGTRWQNFDMPDANALAGEQGLMVTRWPKVPCPVLLGMITRMRDGQAIRSYRVCTYVAKANGVIVPHR